MEKLSKKNIKLLSEQHIMKTLSHQCCTWDCLGKLGRNEIYSMRKNNCNLSEADKNVKLIHYCNNNFVKHHTSTRVIFQINDEPCCRIAFLRAYGYSERKFNRCRQAALHNGIHSPIHGNTGIQKTSSKFSIASVWFSNYCEQNGNLEPNGEIHLCIYNRWKDIYDIFTSEQINNGKTVEDYYTYTSFRQMIKIHFTNIKKPKKTNLPQCNTCSKLAQRRISCQNQIQREQLIEEMKQHSRVH